MWVEDEDWRRYMGNRRQAREYMKGRGGRLENI
jgi:hypothetical protein